MLPAKARLLASSSASLALAWSFSTTALAEPSEDDEGSAELSANTSEDEEDVPPRLRERDDENPDRVEDDSEEDDRFDDGPYIYLSPGGVHMPYGGRNGVDYGNRFDAGYQWGAGIGYFFRTDSMLGFHVGPFFEHAIVNAESRSFGDDGGEHLLRAGLEIEPGIVIRERLFLGLPLRGGYTGNVAHQGGDLDANHGGHFGVGLGLDLALWRGFYVGTALGTDLHFFRSGADYDTYVFTWRARVGYRF